MAGKIRKLISDKQIKDCLVQANFKTRKAAALASAVAGVPVSQSLVTNWAEKLGVSLDKPAPKILVFDIETSPILAYVWGLWDQNISLSQIKQDWYVLCWSAKWLGGEHFRDALCYHKGYKKGNDKEINIISSLWEMLDQCDAAVAHNGKSFDKKKMNAKFLEYGFPEPSPYKIIDPKLIAKANFAFTSNKLDHIAKLTLGEGKHSTSFKLWVGCMDGDKESWDKMIDYCDQDVLELERIYEILKPWDKCHPNYNSYTDKDETGCNICNHNKLSYVNDYHTSASTFEVYKCDSCGHNQRTRKSVRSKNKESMISVR